MSNTVTLVILAIFVFFVGYKFSTLMTYIRLSSLLKYLNCLLRDGIVKYDHGVLRETTPEEREEFEWSRDYDE